MKNLKYVFGAAVFALFGAMNVNAATAQSLIKDGVAKGSCDEANKVCNIELQKKAVEDLEISDGQVVTLDLAGFEFTNYSDGTGKELVKYTFQELITQCQQLTIFKVVN